jgi:hypothetical protein
MDFKDMTTSELMELNEKLDFDVQAIREQRKAINAELSVRATKSKAEDILSKASDAEKDALLQILSPKGIESQAKVGTP